MPSSDNIQRFISGCCEGERCRCGEPAAHKVEETVFYDDPMPHRHPLTAYVCHAHFVEIMGPAADVFVRAPTQVERIEHTARDIAHDLYSRNCFAFTGDGKPHSAECEAAYQRIRATLLSHAREK